jgi:hypothetical protein
MDKNIIGEWGADLNEVNYGRALAALGVLEAASIGHYPPSDNPQEILRALENEFEEGERTVVWRDGYNTGLVNQSSWQKTSYQNAAVLAKAWKLLINKHKEGPNINQPRKRPRLAVDAAWRHRSDLFDLDTLIDWLSKTEVRYQALNLVPEDLSDEDCRYLWHWPIRIGVPTGQSGELLMESLRAQDSSWVKELAQLQWVGEARDSCDLLILPHGAAAQIAERPHLRLRASFIICLDGPVKSSQVSDTPAAQLLKRTGAAGVALVGHIQQKNVHYWYREIIRDLSHDMPIHAATWDVGIRCTNVPPVILGLPRVLDRLRILGIAERIDRKSELLRSYGDLTLRGYPYTPTGLSEYVRKEKFTSEVEYGLPAAVKFSRVEDELDNASQPRWIQADIWHNHIDEKPAKALAPERPSLVSLYIGPSAVKRRDRAFPDQKIDFRDGPVKVDLQIELLGAAAAAMPWRLSFRDYIKHYGIPLDQALRQFITAPEPVDKDHLLNSFACQSISLPAVGSSEQAQFAVWPQPGIPEVSGRIAVIHRNRVIQTARFTAPVGKVDEVVTGVIIQAEQIIHSHLDDLEERRDFDATFIVTDDLGGHLHLTISKGCKPEGVQLDSMESTIEDICSTVSEVTDRKGAILDLIKSVELQDTLVSLAYHGNLLYEHLQEQCGNMIDNIERIQLISFSKSFFPLEYIYSGPSLETNAHVCEEAPEALGRGDCQPCKHKDSSMHLCPLYFWGFSKVIERYANSQISPPKEEEIKYMPTPPRTPFGEVSPVIFAASDIAFKGETWEGNSWKVRLIDSLDRLGAGKSLNVAPDWPKWRDLIANTTPHPKLLMLLPHSNKIKSRVDVLEIGNQSQLAKNLIKKDLIGAIDIPQLLILLGCTTAQVTRDFASYPDKFRSAGADIIIATLAPILGADAVPIAYHISELLAERTKKRQEFTFGELLKQIRCELLAKGHPGVLGLIGFGDADWIFGG